MPKKALAHKPGERWPDDKRMEALNVFAVTGSYTKAEQHTGIPNNTICQWREEDWWVDGLARIREEKQEEHRAMFVELQEQAIEQAKAKLPDATAQQAATIAGIAFDKTRLIDNQPTSIQGKTVDLDALARRFKELSIKHDPRVIAVQGEDEDT